MAANNVTPVVAVVSGGGGAKLATWAMIADSTGLPVSFPNYEIASVEGYGTWDTTGKVLLQGSNVEGGAGTYASLLDNSGLGGIEAPCEFASADGFKAPITDPLYFRPFTSANGAGAAIAVTIIALFKPRR